MGAVGMAQRVVAVVLVWRVGLVTCSCEGPRTANEFIQSLESQHNYDYLTRPGIALNLSTPETVDVQFGLRGIAGIDPQTNAVTVIAYFRKMWTDPRLAFNDTAHGGCFDEFNYNLVDVRNKLWSPDVYLENLVGKGIDAYIGGVWIYPSGYVWWSEFVHLEAACELVYRDFPKDIQTCSLQTSTYRSSTKEVKLQFYNDISIDFLIQEWTNNEFTVLVPQPSDADIREEYFPGLGASWRYLGHRFSLQRLSDHYMKYLYYSHYMVFMVYCGFWVDRKAAPARVAMILLPVLTLVNMMVRVSEDLPHTGYLSWLETCLSTALLFALCSAVEYAMVSWNVVHERKDGTESKKQDGSSVTSPKGPGAAAAPPGPNGPASDDKLTPMPLMALDADPGASSSSPSSVGSAVNTLRRELGLAEGMGMAEVVGEAVGQLEISPGKIEGLTLKQKLQACLIAMGLDVDLETPTDSGADDEVVKQMESGTSPGLARRTLNAGIAVGQKLRRKSSELGDAVAASLSEGPADRPQSRTRAILAATCSPKRMWELTFGAFLRAPPSLRIDLAFRTVFLPMYLLTMSTYYDATIINPHGLLLEAIGVMLVVFLLIHLSHVLIPRHNFLKNNSKLIRRMSKRFGSIKSIQL